MKSAPQGLVSEHQRGVDSPRPWRRARFNCGKEKILERRHLKTYFPSHREPSVTSIPLLQYLRFLVELMVLLQA